MKSIFFLVLTTLAVTFGAYAQNVTKLTVDRADSLLRVMSAVQLLDVRTPGEFANGHLAHATNIDVRDSAFVQNLRQLDPRKPVLVYCLSGGRSAKAASILAQNGYTVYDMQGGFSKWTAAGKTIEGAENAPKGALSMEQFKQLTASTKPVLIDFYAKWCAPCQQMLPMVNRLKAELKDKVTVVTIDYDQNRQLAQQLGVDEIPTFLLYKNQQIKWRGLGTVQEETFRQKINEMQ